MDYLRAPLLFKLKKVLRYVRLYGIRRTLVKIKALRHMEAALSFQGDSWTPKGKPRRLDGIALIGCGKFGFGVIAYYLTRKRGLRLHAVYDKDRARSRSLATAYRAGRAVATPEAIVTDPDVKMVYVASNHATHAEYAIAAINNDKAVHIEKPHAVTEAQLIALCRAMRARPHVPVFLGFNRPKSRLFRLLQKALQRQQGPLMLNWFVAGHEIDPEHWYFREAEGGRVLGNLCHWSDLCLHLVGLSQAFPCVISPVSSSEESDFSMAIAFADRSQAVISFSAKGHAFEGVREYLNVHRGDLLASLQDFQKLALDVGAERTRIRLRHREHGHAENILNSHECAFATPPAGESVDYVYSTGLFILKIREALASGNVTVCDPFGADAAG